MLKVSAIVITLALAGCATAPLPSSNAGADVTTPAAVLPPTVETAPAAPAKPSTQRQARTPPVAPAAASAPSPAVARDLPIMQTRRYDNLIERIQAGFAMPELESPLVAQHERWILRNPEYLTRVFDRGDKYLFHIVEEIEARNMPTELALLPIVESAFNPQALSKAKAAGLWQFIPSTGRVFDLDQNWWTDQRRDVIDSTRAALDYLQKLHDLQGGDWFLALASYNWGEGAVLRARKRNSARGLPDDYLNLKMPRETQNYVPKLIALRNILSRPAQFGVQLPFIPNKPYFVVIDKEQSIDRSLAARFAGLTQQEFLELNPSHHRPVISVSRTDRIIIPADRAEIFQNRMREHIARGEPLVTWKPYTLKSGETLSGLAKRSGVSAQDLIAANSLKRNAQPLPGTVLLAPIAAMTDEPHIETTLARFAGSKVVEKEHIGAVHHKVSKRDNLTRIARRYGVAASEIRRLNNLAEAEPAVGQRLLIRPAKTQTVVTDAQGRRTVLAANTETPPPAAAAKPRSKPAPARSSGNKPPAKDPAKSSNRGNDGRPSVSAGGVRPQ